MELAFAHQTGGASRYWGARGAPQPEHSLGKRALSDQELELLGGGDDGGDAGGCGAGDCGDSGSCSGDSGCSEAAPDPSAIVTMPGVTVIGIAPSAPGMEASTLAAIGTALGGAAGAAAFATGAAGTMALGDAIALGSVLGAIVGFTAFGVTFTGLALLALLANYAATHPGTGDIGNPMGDPGFHSDGP